MIKLPNQPFENIAISLSGGGYRAAAFHLGTLTYLSEKKWRGKALLDRIRILSTVSGGTFIGVKYATTIKNGGTIKQCYKDMYNFMANIDLPGKALKYLSDDTHWQTGRQRSMINAFASIYAKEMEIGCLGDLWESEPTIHLKEICFNATEFNFAIPFRFQKTELAKDWAGAYSYGFIGNNKIRVPLENAKKIRLADIIAASSCFPLGFEPINFPDDFMHDGNTELSKGLPATTYDGDKINYPVGLMDGGIDDNQGIDSVTWAEERMRNYPPDIRHWGSYDAKAIDLFIVSDVSSPYMDNYIRTETANMGVIGGWEFKTFKIIGWLCICSALLFFASCFFIYTKFVLIPLVVMGTLMCLIAIFSFIIANGITALSRKLGVPAFFVDKLNHFNTLNFDTIINLLINRFVSAKIMVSDVFMMQIRRFSYSKVYENEMWRPRLIMNAVYELCKKDVDKRKARQPSLSVALSTPGPNIMSVSEKAKNMGTTLWFTKEELTGPDNMLDTLIACGQYNICFNLLEYIEKWLADPKYNSTYDDKLKAEVQAFYDDMMADWVQFQDKPYWMLSKYTEMQEKKEQGA